MSLGTAAWLNFMYQFYNLRYTALSLKRIKSQSTSDASQATDLVFDIRLLFLNLGRSAMVEIALKH